MNVRFNSRLPGALAFSFARAIQQPALEIWQGEEAHVKAAQQALYHRARRNQAVRRGEYTAAMERDIEASNPAIDLSITWTSTGRTCEKKTRLRSQQGARQFGDKVCIPSRLKRKP